MTKQSKFRVNARSALARGDLTRFREIISDQNFDINESKKNNGNIVFDVIATYNIDALKIIVAERYIDLDAKNLYRITLKKFARIVGGMSTLAVLDLA